MTRERIEFPDGRHVPIRKCRPSVIHKPRTSDRQQPCAVCGEPWAIGFDHRNCKEQDS